MTAPKDDELKFRTIIDNAGEAVLISQAGRMTYFNPALLNIIKGYTAEEVRSKPFLDFVHPEDRALVIDSYRRRVRGDQVPNSNAFRVVTRDGDIRWLETHSSVISWEGGPATLNFASDITDRKKMEETIAQAQKMESIGILAGGLAHDFNNILTAIKGYADLLTDAMPKDNPGYGDLREITLAADRAGALTKQMLQFSMKQPINPVRLDINSVINNMLNMLGRLLGDDIRLLFEPGAGQAWVLADTSQIEQVLMNLAINARDAIETKGVVKIATESVYLAAGETTAVPGAPSGSFLKLTVTDNGKGMSAEVTARIFEPFFTTKALSKSTGLGLSVVYGILKQHNGWINVKSAPGDGTSFEIYLPSAS